MKMDAESQAYISSFTIKEYRIIRDSLEDFLTTCSGDKDIPRLIKWIDRVIKRHENKQQ